MTLSQWMRENPQPAVGDAVFLIDQIAKGIRAMYRRETLHQDIKPDNILIDNHGQVKIIDFGARHVAGIVEIATPLQRDIARGTATHSAHEYTLGLQANYRADLVSLAVISYEMLTGKLPFGGSLEYHQRPLVARDPLRVWKTICGMLIFTQIISLILLLR